MDCLSEEEVDEIRKIFWMINSGPIGDNPSYQAESELQGIVREKNIIVADQILHVIRRVAEDETVQKANIMNIIQVLDSDQHTLISESSFIKGISIWFSQVKSWSAQCNPAFIGKSQHSGVFDRRLFHLYIQMFFLQETASRTAVEQKINEIYAVNMETTDVNYIDLEGNLKLSKETKADYLNEVLRLQVNYSAVNNNLKYHEKKKMGISELRQLLSLVTLGSTQSEIRWLSMHIQPIYYLVINTALDDIITGIFETDLQIRWDSLRCLKYILVSLGIENFNFSGTAILNSVNFKEKIFNTDLVARICAETPSHCVEIRMNSLICLTLMIKHNKDIAIYLINNNFILHVENLLYSRDETVLILVSWFYSTLSAVPLQEYILMGVPMATTFMQNLIGVVKYLQEFFTNYLGDLEIHLNCLNILRNTLPYYNNADAFTIGILDFLMRFLIVDIDRIKLVKMVLMTCLEIIVIGNDPLAKYILYQGSLLKFVTDKINARDQNYSSIAFLILKSIVSRPIYHSNLFSDLNIIKSLISALKDEGYFRIHSLKIIKQLMNFSNKVHLDLLVDHDVVKELFKIFSTVREYDKLLQQLYKFQNPFYCFSIFTDCLLSLHTLFTNKNMIEIYIKKFDIECFENLKLALSVLFEAPTGLKSYLKSQIIFGLENTSVGKAIFFFLNDIQHCLTNFGPKDVELRNKFTELKKIYYHKLLDVCQDEEIPDIPRKIDIEIRCYHHQNYPRGKNHILSITRETNLTYLKSLLKNIYGIENYYDILIHYDNQSAKIQEILDSETKFEQAKETSIQLNKNNFMKYHMNIILEEIPIRLPFDQNINEPVLITCTECHQYKKVKRNSIRGAGNFICDDCVARLRIRHPFENARETRINPNFIFESPQRVSPFQGQVMYTSPKPPPLNMRPQLYVRRRSFE